MGFDVESVFLEIIDRKLFQVFCLGLWFVFVREIFVYFDGQVFVLCRYKGFRVFGVFYFFLFFIVCELKWFLFGNIKVKVNNEFDFQFIIVEGIEQLEYSFMLV